MTCAVAFAAALIVSAAGDSAAQNEEPQVFQDWTVRCGVPEGTSTRRCEMTQVIFADEAKQKALVQVAVLYPPDNASPGMLIILPLGISLTKGVFIGVDEDKPAPVPVERCEPMGCRVELILADDTLSRLKSGGKLIVTLHDSNRRPGQVPISLFGFTAGLKALK